MVYPSLHISVPDMEPGSVKGPDCQATLWQHGKSKVKPESYNWQVGAESGPAIIASVRHSPVIERQGHSDGRGSR